VACFLVKVFMFWLLCCGEWIMRSLWELYISTVVPNDLQAEFGKAPAAEESEGKMQHSCFS
jgi:hypothetical protein